MIFEKWLRKVFKGVSWRNRYLNLFFRCLDMPDLLVRKANGLSHLPEFSVRVRSNGFPRQFGGKLFDRVGAVISKLLVEHAMLLPQSKVLEIGCGRAALKLAKTLEPENYTGIDIDELSIAACRNNRLIKEKGFRFDWMDVFHPIYNCRGKMSASSYKFPYPDKSADVIFLISVFTHMLPEEVSRYIEEISRMLRPGGRCLFTTFLMDYGTIGNNLDFPNRHGVYHLHQEDNPTKAVGYYAGFFKDAFANVGLTVFKGPLLGNWRAALPEGVSIEFSQDAIVFIKGKVR
jgi:SAM-dependent methyltransferase